MCTALSYRTRDHYFGRNLDLDTSYGEKAASCPGTFRFRSGPKKPWRPTMP